MKKKLPILILCIALMCIPTLIAIISYINAQSNPVSENSVSYIKVSMPNGVSEEGAKSSDSGAKLIEDFVSLGADSKSVKRLPDREDSYDKFSVEYVSYNKKHRYIYYLSKTDDNAYYKDSSDNLYKIKTENAGSFLASRYGEYIYDGAEKPILTAGSSNKVMPSYSLWKYRGYKDSFYTAESAVTSEKQIIDVSGGLELSLDREADKVKVTIVNTYGETVFDDFYEEIDPSLFDTNTTYTVTVACRWYQTEERDFYGEQVYNFTANVLSPAVFYLNKSSVEYGQFFIVSAKNIVNPEDIKFSTSPSIDFEPTFFEYGGFYHALVPMSLECMEENNSAEHYTVTLSYGGVKQDLNVNVTARKKFVGYIKTSAEKLNEYRNAATIAAFESAVSTPLSAKNKTLYFMSDNHLLPPVANADSRTKYGFGMDLILEKLKNESYKHEGVDFTVRTGESVMACLPGEVVYVGETKLYGKTIIVDHGGGLKSMYAHLSSVGCDVGDIVTKGQQIGIVGTTGLCYTSPTVHFGLYVFDVPIRYDEYEKQGINLAAAVSEAIRR